MHVRTYVYMNGTKLQNYGDREEGYKKKRKKNLKEKNLQRLPTALKNNCTQNKSLIKHCKFL